MGVGGAAVQEEPVFRGLLGQSTQALPAWPHCSGHSGLTSGWRGCPTPNGPYAVNLITSQGSGMRVGAVPRGP